MRYSYRLNNKEREYMCSLINEAVETVELRDTKLCTEYVLKAIQHTRGLKNFRLRRVVVEAMGKAGNECLPRMINRHAAFKTRSCPLRGKALKKKRESWV